MLNNKQLENLLYDMSSFYRDFLPLDNKLMKLFKIYAKTIDYVWEVYKEASDSRFISTVRTLSTIPYFKLNIDDAAYDLNTARLLARMNFEEQIAYLDKEQKYAPISYVLKDASGEPVVYSMRLFVDYSDTEPLKLYEDYFIRSNRLYLLPNYIQKKRKAVHFLHAFDIKLQDNTLEKNFGTRFSLQAGPLLPRYEYRDVIEAYIRAFQGKMTIKSLKESIALATKWEKFSLEDKFSPTISERKLKLYEDWIISPNKFIVSLPEELIPDKIKINIIRSLMDEIKDSSSDYMVFFDIDRLDPYIFPSKDYPKIYYNRAETGTYEDGSEVTNVSLVIQEYPLDVGGRYDTVFEYNWNLRYDDPAGNEIIGIKQLPRPVKEKSSISDSTQVLYRSSPKIPRSFMSHYNPVTGAITFTVLPSDDGTIHFELYGAKQKKGPYELIEILKNDKTKPLLHFQNSANPEEHLYYKSRAVDAEHRSLFTMTINLNNEIEFDEEEAIDENRLLDDTHAFSRSVGVENLLSYLFDLTIYHKE